MFNGASSLYRAAAGLGLAIVVGGALGIFMAWSKPVLVFIGPLVELFYPLPKSALIPVTRAVARLRRHVEDRAHLPRLHAAGDARRLQRRARRGPGAAVVGARHGRDQLEDAVGRGAAERACRSCSTASAPRWRCRSCCWSPRS